MIAPFIICGAYIFLASIWGTSTGGVTLIIYSELDRPILVFSVNIAAGLNAFAHVGGAACCSSMSGKTAEAVWISNTTRAQYDTGLRKEARRVIMLILERKWGENDLHLHFLPGDEVLLGWSYNT